MKIISKYKDYYDYLVGVYGIDEKLILDRTEFKITEMYTRDTKVIFYICGMIVEGLYRDGKFYFTDQLEQFDHKISKRKWYYYFGGDQAKSYHIELRGAATKYGSTYTPFEKVPKKDINNINDILECPILVMDTFGKHTYKDMKFSKFPILKDYNFSSIYTPEKMWMMIYDFLAKTKDIPNTQTDKEKIISKGFDYKNSFRNTK